MRDNWNYRARWPAPSRAICRPEQTVAPGPVQIQTGELQPAIQPPTAMTNQRQLELPETTTILAGQKG